MQSDIVMALTIKLQTVIDRLPMLFSSLLPCLSSDGARIPGEPTLPAVKFAILLPRKLFRLTRVSKVMIC